MSKKTPRRLDIQIKADTMVQTITLEEYKRQRAAERDVHIVRPTGGDAA